MPEPLKCPWCGASGQCVPTKTGFHHHVRCIRLSCLAAGPTEQSQADAIAAWNRRAEDGEVEALRRDLAAAKAQLKGESEGFLHALGVAEDQRDTALAQRDRAAEALRTLADTLVANGPGRVRFSVAEWGAIAGSLNLLRELGE